MHHSNSVLRNITNLLLLSFVVILLLVGFSYQNYQHSQILLYDYLTRKAVSVSLLYEAKARQEIVDGLPQPPTEILNSKEIASLTIQDREQKILYKQGLEIVNSKIIESVLKNQQLKSYRQQIAGEDLWVVTMPFHLGDLKEGYPVKEGQHQPKFKVLTVAIPISIGNDVTFPAKVQLLLSFSLFIFFIVIAYWQWQSLLSNIAMQKVLSEKEKLASIGMASARLAHEIRNPLAGIKGLAQLLLEEERHIQSKNYLASIIKETSRLNNIITELLEYSKPKKPQAVNLPLLQIMQNFIDFYVNEINAKQLEVKLELPKNLLLYADQELLSRLMHNLMLNALQATKHQGSLLIKAQELPEKTILQVCNSGEPIPIENLNKIFLPFYSTKTKGTGLGLSICMQIVDAHKGQITAYNSPVGPCFEIIFPKEEVKNGSKNTCYR